MLVLLQLYRMKHKLFTHKNVYKQKQLKVHKTVDREYNLQFILQY